MDTTINNEIYNELGERWYTAFDDPVALLRSQGSLLVPWIDQVIKENLNYSSKNVAELGCGGGFLSNGLASYGHTITGIDLSEESLKIAKMYDKTKSVSYLKGDVTDCPLPSSQFDVVFSFDVIEHVINPEKIVSEAYRLLKPGGIFLFHTFNRNWLAYLVVIKFVEWFVRNTPKHLHLLSMFVKPSEVKKWCEECGFEKTKMRGVRPDITTLIDKSIFSRTVPKGLKFKFTSSLWMSYCGFTKKPKL